MRQINPLHDLNFVQFYGIILKMLLQVIDKFEDLVEHITQRIEAHEVRVRARHADVRQNLKNAVHYLLAQLWTGTHIHDEYEGHINKRSNWYSEHERYRPAGLTSRQTVKHAYPALIELNLIRETRGGSYNNLTGEGKTTRFVARNELLKLFSRLKEMPFQVLKPDLDAECIILHDRVDERRVLKNYEPSAESDQMRANLRVINSCLLRHWADLRIKDSDYLVLQQRLLADSHKKSYHVRQPINLNKRILARIFSNGSFEQGGRFYRGWWENVPSEYRPYITINGKRTCEFDYSQLNPTMLYAECGQDPGSEDAYDRVFDGEHRSLVKEAFNAMLQASTPLKSPPRSIDLSGSKLTWKALREGILHAHKAIEHMFFQGYGNHLQYKDSCIAEEVMLHFSKMDHPVLPIHDSFIMHYAFAELGELQDVMQQAFYNHVGSHVRLSEHIGTFIPSAFDSLDSDDLSLEDIILGPPEFSGWNYRNSI